MNLLAPDNGAQPTPAPVTVPGPDGVSWWQQIAEGALTFAAGHWTVIAGIALAAIGALLIRRAMTRTNRPDRVLRRVVGLGILAFSAEGMWEVARQDLGFPIGLALAVFAIGDAAILISSIAAELSPNGSVEQRRHVRAVWVIAIGMGTVVAFSADSPVEIPLRFGLPLLAAFMWKLGLKRIGEDGTVEQDKDALTWMVVPWLRRQVINWGLALPGEKDRNAVDREQQVRKIRDIRFQLHRATETGDDKKAQKLRARLHLLALAADAKILDEARADVQRAIIAEASTRPLLPEEVDAVSAAEARRDEAETTAALARAEAETATRKLAAQQETLARLEQETVRLSQTVSAWTSEAETYRVRAEAAENAAGNLRVEIGVLRQELDNARNDRQPAETAARRPERRQPETRGRRPEAGPNATPALPAGFRVPDVASVAPDTAKRCAAFLHAYPGKSLAELSQLSGVSDKTIGKVRAALSAQTTLPVSDPKPAAVSGTNGHRFPETEEV